MAEALYRKYRPQVFEDVVGQEPIERTLKNAIAQDKVSHAYLFTGPRGTGKTTTARLLAKALLCQRGPTPDPDGSCEDCELVAEGVHPDVYELDAASRTGVENVREEIISRVSFAPTRGRYKVYIIDEVHMLSTAAFNALLKTLEEPPSHVVFVLCTTDPQKVPETIHSRCQRFDFRRIAPESMVSRLGAICIAEDVEFEGEALDLIAHRADGGLRNALTSLEQIIAFENGKVTLAGAERLLGSIDSTDMAEIIAYVGRRDVANCFRWTADYVETGADLAQFVRDMAEHVRNLYVMALVGDDVELDVSETARHELASELRWFGPDRLARLLGVLGDLSAELKTSSNPRLAFEIALTRMVRPDSDLTLESLAERIEALEGGYSAVAHVLPGERVRIEAASPAGTVDEVYPVEFSRDADPAVRPTDQQPRPQSEPAALRSASAQEPAQMATPMPVEQARADARQGQSRQVQMRGDAGMHNQSYAQGVAPSDERYNERPERHDAPSQSQASQSHASQPLPHAEQAGDDRRSALANPAALQRIWQAALSALKKQKQAYGVLFMSAKARYDTGAGMLKVVFPDESAFAFNAVQKPDVQDALAAALAQAVGGQVPFAYEKAGASSSAASAVHAGRGSDAASSSPVQTGAMAQSAAPSADTARPERSQRADAQAAGEQQPFVRQSPVSADGARRMSGQMGYESQPASAQPVHNRRDAPVQDACRTGGAVATAPTGAPAATPIDDVPYEQVPYDEMPYESVPYEEFDAYASEVQVPTGAPAPFETQGQGPAMSSPSDEAFRREPVVGGTPDAVSSASIADSGLTPTGERVEDPSDVEAMLQAGFGGGVIFTEVQE